jgi:SAM-dependent methyltransferase
MWAADKLSVLISRLRFSGSAAYWDTRYKFLGSSGRGSYGAEAKFKAGFVNRFVSENSVRSVIDFGCGDGAQLALLELPNYLGFDVSYKAVAACRTKFPCDGTKQFFQLSEYCGQRAGVALSLDVIYHLVEDEVFEAYLDRLFLAAERFVVIYSTNYDGAWPSGSAHVRHRRISDYCAARFPEFSEVQGIDARFGSGPAEREFMVFVRG